MLLLVLFINSNILNSKNITLSRDCGGGDAEMHCWDFISYDF